VTTISPGGSGTDGWYRPINVWATENQGGDTHVHWVVHVPKSLRKAFHAKVPEWLGRVAGSIRCRESAINVKPVSNLRTLARYLLKGMDSRYAPRYSVRHEPQGLVYGKRCGFSKSLGPAANKCAANRNLRD
jgi:hypothetical protein